ncbi:IS66 family transposase [Variovorax sp. LG9.2]|uniref:IS66 family transposase n=1 Tax=Variovorax sp. LG9.2 TaxID=3048626 RepID=UPI002B236F35|nr:IS66 family transposase [Variovorax sp. LG9.2]MEB0056187.1 IS66 family transposase [Variovorax sp. LG9.2]
MEHHHEPENTNCPNAERGKPMTRVGEDISERLDIVPAEFFVHRHIYGKWACRCCQCLVQEAALPQIIDGGMPAAGLVAHTLISRFLDHLPYYRQEAINARSGVHTPRSTLGSWSGQGSAALMPLYDAHKRFVLSAQVLHADETPVAMLDPGRGKTKRAYVWTYARGAFDPVRGVIYDFCVGRGAQYPVAFLGPNDDGHGATAWRGTLVRDEYAAYDRVMVAQPGRIPAGCLAHARRKFDELQRDAGKSAVAVEALQRIAQIYRIERELAEMPTEERLAGRMNIARPLWEQLHAWLRLERGRVPDGSTTAKALNYSLNAWEALTRNLLDGHVPVDNNHCENLIRPWAMGRRAWLFCGSELAGQRAAIVMSLVQSAKLNEHDPWAYLKDVLTRLPAHLNSAAHTRIRRPSSMWDGQPLTLMECDDGSSDLGHFLPSPADAPVARRHLVPTRLEVLPFLCSLADTLRHSMDTRIFIDVLVDRKCLAWVVDRRRFESVLQRLTQPSHWAAIHGGRQSQASVSWGVLFSFLVAFFPPDQHPIGSPALYTGPVLVGTIVFCVVPLLMQIPSSGASKVRLLATRLARRDGGSALAVTSC